MSGVVSNQNYPEDGYALGRGYSASARLNYQHYLFKDLLGYNISPSIERRPRGNGMRIADVGTGTGIWLTDTHRELPEAQFEGFDISADQYPDEAWRPGAVSLHEWDAFQPPPNELAGKFDIVTVRLFLLVIRDRDPSDVVENLAKLLKPGGYLQWVEHNPQTFRIESRNPDASQAANEAHLDVIRAWSNFSWVANLASTFKACGLVNVSSKAYPIPPELREPFVQLQMMVGEEVSFVAMNNEGREAEGVKFRALLKDCWKETKNGVAILWPPEVVVGRKLVD